MFYQPHTWMVTLQASLTAQERFEAVRRLDSSGGGALLTNKWFVLLGWSVIILLSLLLIAVRQMRQEKNKAVKEQSFIDQANAFNLTPQERDLIKTIADLAEIKHRTMVFNMREAFNSGLSKLKERILTQEGSLEEWSRLKSVIVGVNKKLGFSEHRTRGLNNRSLRGQSSQQIPVGTEVVLTLKRDTSNCIFGAIVKESNDFEMILECHDNLACRDGDIWIVKFQNGSVTWEFEAITVETSGQELKLSHSENVRFVNRLRYQGVKTSQPARIAVFPTFQETVSAFDQYEMVFDSAELIEIAGSSLLFKTQLDLQIRHRVIIMFEMQHGQILQDVGEVRNIVESETDRTFRIELIGLNHKEITDLIRLSRQIALNTPQETPVASGHNGFGPKEVYTDV